MPWPLAFVPSKKMAPLKASWPCPKNHEIPGLPTTFPVVNIK